LEDTNKEIQKISKAREENKKNVDAKFEKMDQ